MKPSQERTISDAQREADQKAALEFAAKHGVTKLPADVAWMGSPADHVPMGRHSSDIAPGRDRLARKTSE
jgi:hypothetical protein